MPLKVDEQFIPAISAPSIIFAEVAWYAMS
jgi:hypothetical protein